MEALKSFTQLPFAPADSIRHLRKNHAMEHATIHVLNTKCPGRSFSGFSTPQGFWIFGKTDLQTLQSAAETAHARLSNGEKKLAVHPSCGTNLAMSGICCAIGGLLAMIDADTPRKRISRFSLLTLAGIGGTYFGKPLGMKTQQYLTTDANVQHLQIQAITAEKDFSGSPAFFVETVLS